MDHKMKKQLLKMELLGRSLRQEREEIVQMLDQLVDKCDAVITRTGELLSTQSPESQRLVADGIEELDHMVNQALEVKAVLSDGDSPCQLLESKPQWNGRVRASSCSDFSIGSASPKFPAPRSISPIGSEQTLVKLSEVNDDQSMEIEKSDAGSSSTKKPKTPVLRKPKKSAEELLAWHRKNQPLFGNQTGDQIENEMSSKENSRPSSSGFKWSNELTEMNFGSEMDSPIPTFGAAPLMNFNWPPAPGSTPTQEPNIIEVVPFQPPTPEKLPKVVAISPKKIAPPCVTHTSPVECSVKSPVKTAVVVVEERDEDSNPVNEQKVELNLTNESVVMNEAPRPNSVNQPEEPVIEPPAEPSPKPVPSVGDSSMTSSTPTSLDLGRSRPPKPPKKVPVQIAYIKSAADFYLHLNQDDVCEKIHDIQHEQTSLKEAGGHQLTDVHVGDVVAAVFQEDGLLYRAKVLSVDRDREDKPVKVKVKYVDWGNEEEVAFDTVEALNPKLDWPAAAIRCSIDFDHHTFLNSEQRTRQFKEMLGEKKLIAEFNDRRSADGDFIYQVVLEVEQETNGPQNVRQAMVGQEKQQAKPVVKEGIEEWNL